MVKIKQNLLQLQCCGFERSEDWANDDKKLPNSCCSEPKDDLCSASDAFNVGCKPALATYFRSHSTILICILVCIAVIEVKLDTRQFYTKQQ